jgi:hypothetical protein
VIDPYTLEDAERDIATLRGQVDRLTEVLTKNDSTDPPTNPAAGLIHYSLGGQHKYASADGSGYNTGRQSLFTAGTQNITSTSSVNITGLTCPVGIGTYRIEGIICGQQGPVAAGQVVRWAGPVISFGRCFTESNAQANTSVTDSDLTGALPWIHTTPAWGNGVIFYVRFSGILTFTAAGTFAIQAAEGTNLDTWTVAAASMCDVMPVS